MRKCFVWHGLHSFWNSNCACTNSSVVPQSAVSQMRHRLQLYFNVQNQFSTSPFSSTL